MIISKPNQAVLVPYNVVRGLWPDIPCVEHDGKTLAIVHHGPREQIQLRAAGIEVPAPILSYYDWEGGEPFNTQRVTAALMSSNTRCYVLSDMGTGKTRSALWAWHFLKKSGCANKLLIVAPLSTLKFTWLREIFITLPGVKAVALHGSRAKRKELLAGDYDIYVVNHDGVRTIAAELHARTDIDTLVLDELAVYRNNSLRSKMMRDFAKRFSWAWGLTGRPMPQAPTDCWAQCKILTPQTCPPYFRHARTALMVQVSQFRWVPKVNALDVAYSWMQPSVRFSLDDVVELPEAVYRTVDVDLTKQQATVYRKMANDLAVLIQEKKLVAANAAVGVGKLLQIACGVVYIDNPQYVTLDSEPRQQMLLELIEEAPEKIIVFAPFRHLITELSKLLTENTIDHAIMHGETTGREEILSAFQNSSKYRVLLAHPKTLHHGVTLTAATTVIWASPPTSLEVYEQANARVRRIGQQHKQQYLHLQSTVIEKKMYAGLRQKQNIQDKFLEMVRTATESGD